MHIIRATTILSSSVYIFLPQYDAKNDSITKAVPWDKMVILFMSIYILYLLLSNLERRAYMRIHFNLMTSCIYITKCGTKDVISWLC